MVGERSPDGRPVEAWARGRTGLRRVRCSPLSRRCGAAAAVGEPPQARSVARAPGAPRARRQGGGGAEQLVAALPVQHRVHAVRARQVEQRQLEEDVRRRRRQQPALRVLYRGLENAGGAHLVQAERHVQRRGRPGRPLRLVDLRVVGERRRVRVQVTRPCCACRHARGVEAAAQQHACARAPACTYRPVDLVPHCRCGGCRIEIERLPVPGLPVGRLLPASVGEPEERPAREAAHPGQQRLVGRERAVGQPARERFADAVVPPGRRAAISATSVAKRRVGPDEKKIDRAPNGSTARRPRRLDGSQSASAKVPRSDSRIRSPVAAKALERMIAVGVPAGSFSSDASPSTPSRRPSKRAHCRSAPSRRPSGPYSPENGAVGRAGTVQQEKPSCDFMVPCGKSASM